MTYGPDLLAQTNKRRKYLLDIFNFNCDCEACVKDWHHGFLIKVR